MGKSLVFAPTARASVTWLSRGGMIRGAHLALAVNNPKATLLMATVKFFGRYKQRNAIREGGCLGYRACAAAGGASEDIHHAQFLDGSAQAGRQDRAPQPPFPRSLSATRLRPRIGPKIGEAGWIAVRRRIRLGRRRCAGSSRPQGDDRKQSALRR